MRVFCLVILLLFSACYTLVAFHDVWKAQSGCHFRIRNWTPIFGWGPTQKRHPKMEAWKIFSFGSIRFANRFCDPKTSIFGSRNSVTIDGPTPQPFPKNKSNPIQSNSNYQTSNQFHKPKSISSPKSQKHKQIAVSLRYKHTRHRTLPTIPSSTAFILKGHFSRNTLKLEQQKEKIYEKLTSKTRNLKSRCNDITTSNPTKCIKYPSENPRENKTSPWRRVSPKSRHAASLTSRK